MKLAKILYFVDGPAPTPEDFSAAADLKAEVVFRNARAVPLESSQLEQCDGVAGCAPESYLEKFGPAEAAIEKYTNSLKALTSKVGDAPAPKAPGKKAAAEEAVKAPVAPVVEEAPKNKPAPAWNANKEPK